MRKDFLSVKDLSRDEVNELFSLTEKLKTNRFEHKSDIEAGKDPLSRKTFALVFEKPSLRTRVTFETGIFELGGKPVYLSPQDIGLGKRESIADVSRNLSQWVSGIVARVFDHQSVVELAKHSTVPVINALSDLEHPCQALADFFTLYEKFKTFDGFKLAYIGDGNNVCRSLMYLADTCGLNMSVATPKGYEPEPDSRVTNDPVEAVKGADVVYTDTWTSMGQESEKQKRLKLFEGFQLNSDLLAHAKNGCLVMHCLPAHREEEITSEVLDSPNSIILDQAANRLHTQKALLVKLCQS
jgi:ornithine carbamoyltransferase